MIVGKKQCQSCNVIIAVIDEHGNEHPLYGIRHKKGCKYNKERGDKTHLLMNWQRNKKPKS